MSRTVVLKIGGSLEADSLAALCTAIRTGLAAGWSAIVVHGGGPRISRALKEAGLELPFVAGRRRTTAAAMPIIERVLVRDVNGELVAALRQEGLAAAGFSGADGILLARPLPDMERTADVAKVYPDRLLAALRAGEVPVLAPIGFDAAGRVYNINADVAAGAVAAAVGAARMVILTDVDGIYRDLAAGHRLAQTDPQELRRLLADGSLSAGMVPKVEAVFAALERGVRTAYIVNGRNPDAIAWAMTSDESDRVRYGTRVTDSQEVHGACSGRM